ncbi:MAG: TonB-dependent receptor [Bacteroidales bacterium]|nr:TonB-dependent receptor [Bacteroidales bacterium]
MKTVRTICYSVTSGLLLGGTPLAQAQAEPAAGPRLLEEVVVTARKREESVQDTPLAVSAVGREQVEAAFLVDATGITQFAPNLVFDNVFAGTPGGGGISIRGVSAQEVEKTFDPAVLMYVDDIPYGVNSGNVMSMLDVERIEVLRGPQGTLFGKNTVGGVIHIHRIKPSLDSFGGKVRARVGNYDRMDLEGVVNIPLNDQLAVKLTAARLEQDRGFYHNITTGKREGDSKEERFGIHLLWQPADNLLGELQYNRSETDGFAPPLLNLNSPNSLVCAGFGACATSDKRPLSGDRNKGAGDLLQDYFLEVEDVIAKLQWGITDSVDATVIYGRRKIEDGVNMDVDGSPLTLFHVSRDSDFTQDSIEARFDYDAGGRLSLTGGYYYWESEVGLWRNDVENPLFVGVNVGDCGFTTPNVDCVRQLADHESTSHSVFFEGDYKLTDQWTLTLGSRWIQEKKEINRRQLVLGANTMDASASRKDTDTIYRLGIRYEPSDDVMMYLMQSTGFRSGGFSVRAATPEVLQAGFKPEKIINTEAGIKTSLLDGRMRLAATVFDMKYKDMQQELNIPGGPTGQQDAVVNASEAKLRGVELELEAILTQYLRVDFNMGYLDAGYKDFQGAIYSDGIVRDLSRLKLRRAPEWNYTLGLSTFHALGSGELTSRISYSWQDDYESTASNHPGTGIDAFGLLDASLSYAISNWKFSVFGRNLTDEDEYSFPFVLAPGIDGSSILAYAVPRAPRTFGAEFTYHFGSF